MTEMILRNVKRKLEFLRYLPLHPQWHLNGRSGSSSAINQNCHGAVLDIGCADRWAEKHVPAGCTYFSLDYPLTGKRIYGAHPNIFADAGRLPFADQAVDTVLLLEVLEHLPDPDAALAEIHRVMRSGGCLILSIPFLYPIHDAPWDFQRFTSHGLQRRLNTAGFRVETIECSTGTAETAGLLCAISLAGMALTSIHNRHPALVLAPLLLVLIPFVNLATWLAGKVFPSWPAFTAGYRVIASRRA